MLKVTAAAAFFMFAMAGGAQACISGCDNSNAEDARNHAEAAANHCNCANRGYSSQPGLFIPLLLLAILATAAAG